ncbi:VWA domain-containing protein [Amaricoccus solimangrovi]|uniref:VWA domain-containing protein n=1 Tax=Amaricoccus solimangrovi TaxID=2589815 RepID=A0A501WQ60_9RHOB|nr:VWA domain-containing protein [Amaricoccus solimangrovi]TPE50234.1 VWA domain-containing protein [Amaricoccus solimangrovi]
MYDLAAPFFLLLLPLPFLALRLLPPRDPAEGALRLPEGIAAEAAPVQAARRWRGPRRGLAWLAWIGLVLALAGPVRLEPTRDTRATGRDIMLALDMSGSMLTEDFDLDGAPVSRLDAVKRVAGRFVTERPGDRIGLVLFGDRAYVAAPLTWDLAAVGRAIEEAGVGVTGRSTAIAEGLGLALKRIIAADGRARVIVLLSDGRDTANRLDATGVARLAAEHGVRIHTIALGPADLESQPSDREAVDTATLRAIAEASGGKGYRVRGTADLVAMAADLDRIEPNPSGRPPVLVPRPLWPWPAALALLAAAALGALPLLRLPRLRRGFRAESPA